MGAVAAFMAVVLACQAFVSSECAFGTQSFDFRPLRAKRATPAENRLHSSNLADVACRTKARAAGAALLALRGAVAILAGCARSWECAVDDGKAEVGHTATVCDDDMVTEGRW